MGTKLGKILVGMTLCLQTAPILAAVKIVQGAVFPNPFEDTVSIDLYNEGDQDVSCHITVEATAVSGNGSGPFKGVVTSDPVTKVLRAGRDYTHNIPFNKAMRNIRNRWHDQSAVIAEVVPSGISFSCEATVDGGDGNDLFVHEQGTYMIKSRWSGRCLNLQVPNLESSVGLRPGVPVITYDCPPQDNKWRNNYWKVVQVNGYNKLVSDFSERIVRMNSYPFTMEQGNYYPEPDNGPNYDGRLKFKKVNGGYQLVYEIKGLGSYCVTLQGYANHSEVKGEVCNPGSIEQIWDLERAYTYKN